MEAGQTSGRDISIYHQVSAYFHSLNPEVPTALKGVNGLMTTVCEGCSEIARDLLPMALCNWYLYLKEVCEGEPPEEVLTEWNKAVQVSGLNPRPKVISFPTPDTWTLEDELISTDDVVASTPATSQSKPTTPPPPPKRQVDPADSESPTTKRILQAFVALLVVCLAISKLFGSSPEKPEAKRSLDTQESAVEQVFTGKPSLSISGVSLGQSWDEIDALRDWEDRQTTILSSYTDDGYLTVRFDSNKNLKSVEGHDLMKDGRPLFTLDTNLDQVLSRFGEPSERNGRGPELTYVYDDAGQKCTVTLTFRNRSGEYNHRTGQEITSRVPQLERVRLSLAGTRWENVPSAPILAK